MKPAARPASTICLVRDGRVRLEVLMVRRTTEARFMAGAWVFPGGALDPIDSSDAAESVVRSTDRSLLPWRAAALRELVEETAIWLIEDGEDPRLGRADGPDVFRRAADEGVTLDGDRLAIFSHWTTPAPLPVRFDTRFFLARVGDSTRATVDGTELIDETWVAPATAGERAAAGTWVVAFPTLRTLEFLAGHDSVDSLLGYVAGLGEIRPVQPRLAVDADSVRILMPDDEGFEAAGVAEQDPDLPARLAVVAGRGGIVPAELRRS